MYLEHKAQHIQNVRCTKQACACDVHSKSTHALYNSSQHRQYLGGTNKYAFVSHITFNSPLVLLARLLQCFSLATPSMSFQSTRSFLSFSDRIAFASCFNGPLVSVEHQLWDGPTRLFYSFCASALNLMKCTQQPTTAAGIQRRHKITITHCLSPSKRPACIPNKATHLNVQKRGSIHLFAHWGRS